MDSLSLSFSSERNEKVNRERVELYILYRLVIYPITTFNVTLIIITLINLTTLVFCKES